MEVWRRGRVGRVNEERSRWEREERGQQVGRGKEGERKDEGSGRGEGEWESKLGGMSGRKRGKTLSKQIFCRKSTLKCRSQPPPFPSVLRRGIIAQRKKFLIEFKFENVDLQIILGS